jgi:hypothetical protein
VVSSMFISQPTSLLVLNSLHSFTVLYFCLINHHQLTLVTNLFHSVHISIHSFDVFKGIFLKRKKKAMVIKHHLILDQLIGNV